MENQKEEIELNTAEKKRIEKYLLLAEDYAKRL